MLLSYFIQPVHPLARNYNDILKEDIASVILADKLGYEEALIGEHFTDLAEPITSCLMFIARLISETKTIKLGSGVLNLPVYHPVMAAAHIAMMDNMLEGRFVWGLDLGGNHLILRHLVIQRLIGTKKWLRPLTRSWNCGGEKLLLISKGNFIRFVQKKLIYLKLDKV